MKKHLIIGILAIVLIMPIVGAENITHEKNEVQPSTVLSGEDFTHIILTEFVGQTTCGYCPPASSQLYSIYNTGDYDFYYVSMIVNENPEVYGRVTELGVTGTPDVYFDGGYRNIPGAQDDEQPYRNAIVQSGERTVPDIDIDITVEWKGNAVLKITVTVQNNEAEEYDGHLRVYIVEPESRWSYAGGNSVHYGVLDIPIDKNLAMPQGQPRPLGDTYTFTRTWFGSIHGFGDISQDNILVIAAVFDGESDYAVQTAAAEPTTSTEQFRLFENFKIFQFMRERGILFRLFNLIANL